jgi:hypothetical protein
MILDQFWLTDVQLSNIALHLPRDTRGKCRAIALLGPPEYAQKSDNLSFNEATGGPQGGMGGKKRT